MVSQIGTVTILENSIFPALTRNDYALSESGKPGRYRIGSRPNGRDCYADAVVTTIDGLQIIISVNTMMKEHIPFEAIMLLRVLEQSQKYARAYIVLGDKTWTPHKSPLDKQFYKYIPAAKGKVQIISLAKFVEIVNAKKL